MMRTTIFWTILLLLASILPSDGDDGRDTVVRVTCVGDSTTGQGYPELLQTMLGNDGWAVRNAGVGAATVIEGTLRPYRTTREYADAMDSRPDYVIVMLGTNDANPAWWNDDDRANGVEGGDVRDEFRSRYLRLIEDLRGLDSHPTIIIAIPLAVHPEGANSKWRESAAGRRDNLRNDVVPIIREVARRTGARLVDVPACMGESSARWCKGDGVHYNRRGYERLARIFRDELLRMEEEGRAAATPRAGVA